MILEQKLSLAEVARRLDVSANRLHEWKTVAENVLDRAFDAPAPNVAWVADITYIPTREGWLSPADLAAEVEKLR
jgi:transposase-like protein